VSERLEAAAFAWQRSRETCARDAATGESCRWHHGLWPWLRVFGLATSPALFAEFYAAAFARALARAPSPRVLVSGAADFEMLARVGAACARGRIAAEIVCADLCETPLALGRWWAEGRGLPVETVRGDVLALESSTPFDVICSDSFLGQFAPAARERLVARWAALAATGGALITVNRLRPDADPERRVGFSAEQARAFVARVCEAAASLPAAARPDPAELAREAARYAERQGAWPVRSAEEIAALLARGGFAIESLEVAPIAGEAAGPTAPTLAGGALYARVVARRRT
jgi:hypothetical protein